ncbi:MAG: hypothetical protein ACTSQE_17335 [Candidatus Heimdallarchaeaceae archaeon]
MSWKKKLMTPQIGDIIKFTKITTERGTTWLGVPYVVDPEIPPRFITHGTTQLRDGINQGEITNIYITAKGDTYYLITTLAPDQRTMTLGYKKEYFEVI